jgi:NAD(P)-dependent dehydrogenase (short-subunit alcohol dehydrogenase family)
VVGAVRDMEKMEAVAEMDELDMSSFTPMQLELNSFDSVKQFCEQLDEFKAAKPIDRLICNAAVYQPSLPYAKWSVDGHEQQMQINYLSHFLLISKLLDDIAKAPDPRVILVGSVTGNDNTVGGGGVYPVSARGAGASRDSAGWARTAPLSLGPERCACLAVRPGLTLCAPALSRCRCLPLRLPARYPPPPLSRPAPQIADLKELEGFKHGFSNPISMADGYNFIGAKAYKDSKLCLMMTSNMLHDRYHKQTGIAFSSIYPGCIAESPLFREKRPWFRKYFPIFMKYITVGASLALSLSLSSPSPSPEP